MGKTILSTEYAPGAIGPYSQGIAVGNMVFTSGQLPINPVNGQLITDDIREATKQAIENVQAILSQSGVVLDDVVKTTIFVKDLADFSAINEVYSTYFKENCPARSCVQVAKLPLDALLEIEAIAVKSII
jgi:endoribonuclease L-PSP, putative